MFEDSLVESRVGHLSAGKGWTTLASISFQFAVAAIVIALPWFHPEALPFHSDAPKMLLPLPPKPPVPVVRAERASATSTSTAAPSTVRAMIMPRLVLSRDLAANDTPALAPIGMGMGASNSVISGIGVAGDGHGPSVTVAQPRATGRISVSKGVSQGMLIAPIRPVYPAIAKAAHVEGTVVVEAIISVTGTVESLHVLNGPAMLQSAAIDAIQAARYQPYRLNDVPTEVQTTITVNFRLGG
jgi:periplasmic protein TonB